MEKKEGNLREPRILCSISCAPSPGCLKASSYIIGGFLMFWTVLVTTVCALGLPATLVFREVGLPALRNLPHFNFCDTYNNCKSSVKIIQQIEDGIQGNTGLNILIISISVVLVLGLLKIGFLSVLLHGITTGKAKLIKIFCIYYAVMISIGTVVTATLMMNGFMAVSFNWICLPLHFLCLLVINHHRTAILAQDGFVKF